MEAKLKREWLFGVLNANTSGEQNKEDIFVAVNVKDILLPVISFLRLYTLKNQLDATNSLDRAKKLYECGEINQSLYEEIVLSYNYLMNIRLRFQAADVLENKDPGNVVDLHRLTNIEVETIKKIFAQIGALRSKLGLDYKCG